MSWTQGPSLRVETFYRHDGGDTPTYDDAEQVLDHIRIHLQTWLEEHPVTEPGLEVSIF